MIESIQRIKQSWTQKYSLFTHMVKCTGNTDSRIWCQHLTGAAVSQGNKGQNYSVIILGTVVMLWKQESEECDLSFVQSELLVLKEQNLNVTYILQTSKIKLLQNTLLYVPCVLKRHCIFSSGISRSKTAICPQVL